MGMVTAQATAARLVQVLKAASRFRAARERQAWRTTHRVADAARPKFVSTLLLEMRDTRNKVNVARLSRAVASGNVTEIENALLLPKTDENLRRKYRRQIRDTLNEAGIKNVKLQPKVLAANFGRFDLTNPRAVRWAESKAATLVREITEGQRAVIRRVVAQGIQDGIPVSGTARRLRATVGLTVRQAEQVMRFQSTQIARGVPVDLATQRAERLSQKVLRRRAENIARTETIAASTQGRQELWDQAQEKGLIDGDQVQRKWIVTPDDRLDSIICEPMSGQIRGLKERFVTGLGDEVDAPPAHPQCRCDVILVIPGRSVFA